MVENGKFVASWATSTWTNIWLQRGYFVGFAISAIVGCLAHFSWIMLVKLILGYFLFSSFALFGIVAIFVHVKYYFQFERGRSVEVYSDKMTLFKNCEVVEEIQRAEVLKIILCDKLKSDGYNLWPTYADSFYYLVIIRSNHQRLVLTCLLDLKLKETMKAWLGHEFQHKYQFIPLPGILNC